MDAKREVIYQWLSKEFRMFEGLLDPTAQVELDGKLWGLAAQLADGKINALLSEAKVG